MSSTTAIGLVEWLKSKWKIIKRIFIILLVVGLSFLIYRSARRNVPRAWNGVKSYFSAGRTNDVSDERIAKAKQLNQEATELEETLKRIAILQTEIKNQHTYQVTSPENLAANDPVQPVNPPKTNSVTTTIRADQSGNGQQVIILGDNNAVSFSATSTNSTPVQLAGMPTKPDREEHLLSDDQSMPVGSKQHIKRRIPAGNGTVFHTPIEWECELKVYGRKPNYNVWINNGTKWVELRPGQGHSGKAEAYWIQPRIDMEVEFILDPSS